MEALTVAQAFELLRVNEAQIITQFETWLMVTFSTIVAVFSASKILTKAMRVLITFLYFSTSVTLLAISIYLAESNVQLIEMINNKGSLASHPVFAAISLLTLVVIGTTTTCYFIQAHNKFFAKQS